ncbi:MAG: hypothetical protein ACFFD4_31230 [Candidatus Odinarchaeota archaeon]
MSSSSSTISKWSWLVVIFYILLALFTYFSIAYFEEAASLFEDTKFWMEFNFLWFGLIIVVYGIYALYQNYSRMKRLGRTDPLDTQLMIVMTFIFLTLYITLEFVLYATPESFTETQLFAIDSTAKVILYGALLCGLLSIIMPKMRGWWKSRV